MHDLGSFDLVFVLLGAVTLVFGSVALLLKKKTSLSEAVVGLAVGIVIGPSVLGAVQPESWDFGGETFLQATRFAVGMQIVSTTLRLPCSFLRRPDRITLVLLGVIMPITWVVSAGLVWAALGGGLWNALLVGAVLTPTDPVLITSIVTGFIAERSIPGAIRTNLSAESAANDSLAFPFVLFSALMLSEHAGAALGDWGLDVLLRETVGGAIGGALAGWVFGKLLVWADAHDAYDKRSFLVFTVAFTVFVLGGAHMVGVNGLLAVFTGSATFSVVVEGPDRARAELIEHVLDRVVTIPIFMLFGMVLPWGAWVDLGLPGLALVLAVLTVRRIPAIVAVKPLLRVRLVDALVLGWFGPVGIGALFYAAYIHEQGGPDIWPVVSLTVFASTLAHGFSAVPLARLYAHRAGGPDARVVHASK